MSLKNDSIRVATVAALSAILQSRNAFPSECFRVFARKAITLNYDRLIKPDTPSLLNNESSLNNNGSFVFLQKCNNSSLKGLLTLLEKEYFPLLAEGLMKKLYMCTFETQTRDFSALLEAYELDFSSRPFNNFIRITFTGRTDKQISFLQPTAGFQSLSNFLSQLPQQEGPTYNALFACIVPNTHRINLDRKSEFDVDAAIQLLRQKPAFKFYEVSTIFIGLEGRIEEASLLHKMTSMPDFGNDTSDEMIKQSTASQPHERFMAVNASESLDKSHSYQSIEESYIGARHKTLFVQEQENNDSGLFNYYFSSPIVSPVSRRATPRTEHDR